MTSILRQSRLTRAATFLAFASSFCLAAPSLVGATSLMPQTKLRLTVVQWQPVKGEYAKWDAVSGDFTVSASGTISLPLIGTMDVSSQDEAAVASTVERRLKDKLGLVALPNATVEVMELPPVYVVGWVATPGSFAFRDGLTVLQALALGGGVYRAPAQAGSTGQISLLGDVKKIRSEILYALGRQARLRAEQANDREIAFPAELTENPNRDLTKSIIQQENLIFKTRADSLARQLTSLSELGALYDAEIDALQQKGQALDRGLTSMQTEFTGVEGLVKRGVATVSRRSELERAISVMQSQRLDQMTAIIRARQTSNEAVRNALALKDQMRTDIASALQDADINLESLRTRSEIAQRLLLASPEMDGQEVAEISAPAPTFTIVRKVEDHFETLTASETTALLPGDVVKVSTGAPDDRRQDPQGSGTPLGPQLSEATASDPVQRRVEVAGPPSAQIE